MIDKVLLEHATEFIFGEHVDFDSVTVKKQGNKWIIYWKHSMVCVNNDKYELSYSSIQTFSPLLKFDSRDEAIRFALSIKNGEIEI